MLFSRKRQETPTPQRNLDTFFAFPHYRTPMLPWPWKFWVWMLAFPQKVGHQKKPRVSKNPGSKSRLWVSKIDLPTQVQEGHIWVWVVKKRNQKHSRMHFEVGNRSGRVEMGSQLANLAAVWPLWQRGQKVDLGGRKSTFPPRSRKVIYGSAGSKYASKIIPACILTTGTGLDGPKWGPNWQIWLLYGLYDRGVKKSVLGVENRSSHLGPGRSYEHVFFRGGIFWKMVHFFEKWVIPNRFW